MQHVAANELPRSPELGLAFSWWLSRADWRRMPFDRMPPYLEFLLVFDPFDTDSASWVDDWSGRTLFARSELDDIIADQLKYRRSVDGPTRAKFAKRMRRRWVSLVDHAIGYRAAGSYADIFEFADR